MTLNPTDPNSNDSAASPSEPNSPKNNSKSTNSPSSSSSPSLASRFKSKDSKLEPQNENELVYKYGLIIGIAALAIVIGVGGYYTYDYFSQEKREKQLTVIYDFENGPWKKYQDKKITSDALLKDWQDLQSKVGDNKRMASLGIKFSQSLVQEKKFNEASSVLSPLQENFRSDPYLFYLLSTALAALDEDSGKFKEAIQLLEEVLKGEAKFLPAKIYFDLGRLYKKDGQLDKAKINFQYVIDHYPDDRMAHLSKLFLKKF